MAAVLLRFLLHMQDDPKGVPFHPLTLLSHPKVAESLANGFFLIGLDARAGITVSISHPEDRISQISTSGEPI
jgi:hypothetical protein